MILEIAILLCCGQPKDIPRPPKTHVQVIWEQHLFDRISTGKRTDLWIYEYPSNPMKVIARGDKLRFLDKSKSKVVEAIITNVEDTGDRFMVGWTIEFLINP